MAGNHLNSRLLPFNSLLLLLFWQLSLVRSPPALSPLPPLPLIRHFFQLLCSTNYRETMKSQKRIKRGLSQAAARCATSKLLFGGSSSSVPCFWDQTKTASHASLESSENMATRPLQALQPHSLFIKCQGGKRRKGEKLQRGCWTHC